MSAGDSFTLHPTFRSSRAGTGLSGWAEADPTFHSPCLSGFMSVSDSAPMTVCVEKVGLSKEESVRFVSR